MPAVNEYASEIGLTQTVLNRRMMDFAAGDENYTSANDVARMLQLIYQGKLVSSDMSEFALDLMKGQHDDAGLLEGLPVGSVFAHKTGTLDGVFNDGGIVLDQNPYVMVVLPAMPKGRRPRLAWLTSLKRQMPLLANGYAARFFLAACNGVGRSLQAAFVAVVFSVAPASVRLCGQWRRTSAFGVGRRCGFCRAARLHCGPKVTDSTHFAETGRMGRAAGG